MVGSAEWFDRSDARRNNRNRGVAELIEEWFNPARPRKAIGIEKRNERRRNFGKTSVTGSGRSAICCAANTHHGCSVLRLRGDNDRFRTFVIDDDDASDVADAIEQTLLKFAAHRNNDTDVGGGKRRRCGNRL